MRRTISFMVDGIPAPKGSYRPITQKSRISGKPVTRLIPMSRKEKPWRQAVVRAVSPYIRSVGRQIIAPVEVTMIFFLPRPKTVSRETPTVKPDLDKLLRSTFDGLTDSGIIKDDSQITRVEAAKNYAAPPLSYPGASIQLWWEEL